MRRLALLGVLSALLFGHSAGAAMMAGMMMPGCRPAIEAAERASGSPPGLLGAIARVESGRRDPDSGRMEPWPWTANVEGTGYFYETKAQAIAAIRGFQAQGIRSIDIGCMQVNLMHHPDAFPNLETAFDPAANAAYAARFLGELREQTGDWGRATGMYHSATPALGAEYQRKVFAALPDEQRFAAAAPPARQNPVARAWSASLSGPLGTPFGTGGGIGAFRRPMGGAGSLGGGGTPVGRSLAAYRAMPVRTVMAARIPMFVRR
ncbi:MAG: transglycosylase SLT domain-containing protein [Acetobacteraceae bacterium]